MKHKKALAVFTTTLFLIVVLAVLWLHAVSNALTSEDGIAVQQLVKSVSIATPESPYGTQIEFIRRVQDSVLATAPVNKGIPYGQPREPKDLLDARQGLCFDRSRVIEKILRYYGFDTRHVFIYSTKKTGSSVRSFVTPGVASHAVTEVYTGKGWLVVDSNDRWISVDADNNPHDMADIQEGSVASGKINWKTEPPTIYKDLAPFTFIYGLYSRHGEFYPPYNPIPDVNYGELLYNFY